MEPKSSPPVTALAPTVGRIVHFHPAAESAPEAAIVIAVGADGINLQIWNGNGTGYSRTNVQPGEGAGEWRWPPRV